MIKLDYPVQNSKWPPNDLTFMSWQEYWKTLGYLSNPIIHRHMVAGNNTNANLDIMYERNSESNSYSNTARIYYYGNENAFSREFPSLYGIRTSSRASEKFRLNRKEFGETLLYDLGFIIQDIGRKDDIIIPPPEDIILSRINTHQNFDINSWNEGYNLGNL